MRRLRPPAHLRPRMRRPVYNAGQIGAMLRRNPPVQMVSPGGQLSASSGIGPQGRRNQRCSLSPRWAIRDLGLREANGARGIP